MKNLIKGFLKVNLPLHQSVRLRHRRFNFKYIRPPPHNKALVEQVCRPVLPLDIKNVMKPPREKYCGFDVSNELLESEQEQLTPYENILAREARNRMDHAKWIAFFHKNPVEELEFLDMQVLLKRQCGMKLFEYDNKIVRHAMEGTKYESALILFQSDTYFGFADQLKVKELVRNLKKLPKIILIGGFIENRLLTAQQIEYYASLPDITTMQSRLVNVLNMPAQTLIKYLTFHQRDVVSKLEKYEKILKSGEAPTSSEKPEDSRSSSNSESSSGSESSSESSDSDSDDDKKKQT